MDLSFTKLVLLSILQLSIAEDECDPTIDGLSANVTVKEGQTAILPCAIENKCHYKVVWTDQWSTLLTLDERRIIDDTRISIERPDTRDWNLLIKDTKYTDRGQYTCQTNTNPVTTKTVMLKVLEEEC